MKKTFAYLGTHEIGKTTVVAESIKFGLSNVVVTEEKCYCVVCGEEFTPEKKYHNFCDWCAENTCYK